MSKNFFNCVEEIESDRFINSKQKTVSLSLKSLCNQPVIVMLKKHCHLLEVNKETSSPYIQYISRQEKNC